jgi:hypothetical protein
MTTVSSYPTAPDLSADDYVVVGLATCFVKEEGEVRAVTLLEPVPSAYLEALLKGVPTSYQSLHGVTLGQILNADGQPQEFAVDEASDASLSPDFVERAFSAARTYQSRISAQALVPVGTIFKDINYSTEKKRILNLEQVVTAEDNVKQHQYTHMTL